MRVSFIIPVKSINDYVQESISHLQTLDGSDWEAFVVTNETENPPWQDERIRVIVSGRVGPGDKRDLAAKHATGKILVFLDDDSYPFQNYLTTLRNCFSRGFQVVGGPAVTPPHDGYWQQVSGAMYLSKLTGGSPERHTPVGTERLVDDWPSVNLAVSRAAFAQVGGFDCPYWPGEDTHLCDKLTSAGIAIVYAPEVVVWHHRRANLRSHLKQVGAYGLHRGFFARRYRKSSLQVTYFAPSALVVAFTSLIVLPSGVPRSLMTTLVFGYGLVLAVAAIVIGRKVGPSIAAGAVVYAFVSHLWYGLRFGQGFLFVRELKSKLR